MAGLASPRITTVMSSEAWDAYGIPMSPYFVLVDGTRGVIGEGAAASWAQVIDLLGKAAADAGLAVDGRDVLTRRDLLRGRYRRGAGRPGAGRRRHRARVARPLPGPPPDRRDRGPRAARRRAAVSTPVLVVGLVSAVLGAVRASWSP